MKVDELLYDCECVMVDEDDNILDEAAVRQGWFLNPVVVE